MRALTLEAGVVALKDVPPPVPTAGEALVRVSMAGICNTDLELARGYMSYSGVLGHELCGVVEACDDASWLGKRVAGEINLACGRCPTCTLERLPRHCPTRTVLGILGKQGCFAEHVTLPVENLHALPDAIDDVRGCFVEPTAAAFEVLEQVSVEPGQRVVVLGDGKLGLLLAQVLAQAGAQPIVVGRHTRKLELARTFGVETAALTDLPRKGFALVIEATGSPEGLARAVELTRPRGTLVLKSTFHGALQLDAAPLVIDELTLVGSRCGPFDRAIAALAAGSVSPERMLDAVVPFAQAEDALRRAAEPGTLKVLMDMRGRT